MPHDHYTVTTHKPYDDVLAELHAAIAEHNFRITAHSRVGKVIREREGIAFPEYDTVQFCNLTQAKEMLELSPHAVRYMPCNIVLYQYDGAVVLSTALLPENHADPALNDVARRINQSLRHIIDFAAEE